jgi:hypothetical protein
MRALKGRKKAAPKPKKAAAPKKRTPLGVLCIKKPSPIFWLAEAVACGSAVLESSLSSSPTRKL